MSLLVVVAHYDDEIIGASDALFRHRGNCLVLHVTDSAPLDLAYTHRAGFQTREQYSFARRKEMLSALRLAGIHSRRCLHLKIPDQEAPRHLARISSEIQALASKQVTQVFTHAWEGGHPDHDACALATRLALAKLPHLPLYEMPFYHRAPGQRVAGEFIPHAGAGPIIAPLLSPEAIKRKQAMFARFPSQAHVFARFAVDREPIRLAPRYHFLTPPHEGQLYYETRPLNWTWAQWQATVAPQLERLSP